MVVVGSFITHGMFVVPQYDPPPDGSWHVQSPVQLFAVWTQPNTPPDPGKRSHEQPLEHPGGSVVGPPVVVVLQSQVVVGPPVVVVVG